MLLWILLAGLTAAVLAVVLRPAFAVPTAHAEVSQSADLAVYKEQLDDLDRQVAQGRIDATEYDALRHEVARRIMRTSDKGRADTGPKASVLTMRTVPAVVAVIVSLGSLALYLLLGAPAVPGRPFAAASQSLSSASADELIAKVEARLAAAPNDGRGWDAIAPIYLRLERFDDAAQAYQRAAQLLGETPQRLAGLAEATVAANDGIVTEAARAAYEKLAVISPDRVEPRFWLALAKEQDGKREAAAADYRAILKAAPADAPWRGMVEQRLAGLAGTAKPLGGPTEADIKASAAVSEADRSAMIAGMVDALAARLKTDGRDPEGWQRLITSYTVLKLPDKARAALADARAALAGDIAANAALDVLARRLEAKP